MTRLLLVLALAAGPTAYAQQDPKRPAKPAGVPPIQADVAYGTHPRQVLDFFQAMSDAPTPVVFAIHGGGWVNGDKSGYPRSSHQDSSMADDVVVVITGGLG